MSVLHDDSSDAMAAIEAAEMSLERRRSSRIRRKVATEMVAWEVGRAPQPFGVVIEDISEIGVGIIHSEELPRGSRYLLTVPRVDTRPVIVECVVARCEKRGERSYTIGLAACQRIDNPEGTRQVMTVTTRRTRLLFLLFGLVGLAVAVFIPL